MSVEELAARVGLTVSEYSDVEAHPDEFIEVIATAEARALCNELRLRLVDLVGVEMSDTDLFAGQQWGQVASSRSTLLRHRRESLGVSIAEMAFAIGFDEAAVEQIERDELYLDSLPIAVVAEVSKKLNLPLANLLELD
jgi:transcriptional regulator with XRE-family HTH domain